MTISFYSIHTLRDAPKMYRLKRFGSGSNCTDFPPMPALINISSSLSIKAARLDFLVDFFSSCVIASYLLYRKNRRGKCHSATLYKRNTTSSFDAAKYKNPRAAGFTKITSQVPVGHICQFLLLSSHLKEIPADRPGYFVTWPRQFQGNTIYQRVIFLSIRVRPIQ